MHQTDCLFVDSYKNYYFQVDFYKIFKSDDSNTDTSYRYKYSEVSLSTDFEEYNVERVTSNNEYFFVAEMTHNSEALWRILIIDKKFDLDKCIYFNEDLRIIGFECTNKYLYWIQENKTSFVRSLIRYDLERDIQETLCEDVSGISNFNDGDTSLFIYKGYIRKHSEKTLLYSDLEPDRDILFYKDITISRSKKILSIATDSYQKDYDYSLIFNRLSSGYLIKDKLVFSAFKYEQDKDCLTNRTKMDIFCICGIKETYLFEFDLKTGELSLRKTLNSGSFLIDFDLENIQYYYEGGLYVNDICVQKCHKITVGETISAGWDYRYETRDQECIYYLAYYDGRFFGI